MTPFYKVDFQVARNEDLRQAFALGRDLNGCTFRMQIRDSAGALKATLASGSGITVTDAAGGLIKIALDDSAVAAIPAGTYKHDLLMYEGTETTRIWMGEVRVLEGITVT